MGEVEDGTGRIGRGIRTGNEEGKRFGGKFLWTHVFPIFILSASEFLEEVIFAK